MSWFGEIERHKDAAIRGWGTRRGEGNKIGGFLVKVLIVAVLLIYIISPVDLIPDVIPVIGWIDDAAAAVIAASILKRVG